MSHVSELPSHLGGREGEGTSEKEGVKKGAKKDRGRGGERRKGR